MPWTKYVGDFLNKRFPQKKDGNPGRSSLVDDYFGQMFQSYAKTCISYALSASIIKGSDNISSKDITFSINRLFPTNNYESDSQTRSSYELKISSSRQQLLNRKKHTNLSKDRKSLIIKQYKLVTTRKHSQSSPNTQMNRKSLFSHGKSAKSEYIIPPSRPISLSDVFDVPLDDFE